VIVTKLEEVRESRVKESLMCLYTLNLLLQIKR